MFATVLLLSIGADPTPPPFVVQNKTTAFVVVNKVTTVPKLPSMKMTYAALIARVRAGERVTVTFPGDVADPPPGVVGVWECFLENGKPVMREVGSAARPFVPGSDSTVGTNAQPAVPASTRLPGSTAMAPTIIGARPAEPFGGTSDCGPSG